MGKVNAKNLVDYIIKYEAGEEEISKEEYLDLFSYLIKSGNAWTLQGHYGRSASDLIESKIIDEKGEIK